MYIYVSIHVCIYVSMYVSMYCKYVCIYYSISYDGMNMDVIDENSLKLFENAFSAML